MMMKKVLSLVLLLFVTTSCNQVYFEQPQPRLWPSVPVFPKSIQGSYPILGDESGVIVSRTQITIKDERIYTLGKDVVVKRYFKHWIVSLWNGKNDAWEVYAIDDSKTVKVLNVRAADFKKVNTLLGREVFIEQGGEVSPLSIRRKEFKVLLKEVFVSADFPMN